jgi:hypothetical protein
VPDPQGIVTAGGGQSDHGRRHRSAARHEYLAPAGFLARLPPLASWPRVAADLGAAHHRVLAAQYRRGPGGHHRASGYFHGAAVTAQRGRRLAGQDTPGQPPRARAADRIAVDCRGREGRQVAGGQEVSGERSPITLRQRQCDLGQHRGGPGPVGDRPGGRPGKGRRLLLASKRGR